MSGRAGRQVAAAALALAAVACPGAAQEAPSAGSSQPFAVPSPAPVASAVLTIDQEGVFQQSAYGRRLQADLEARAAALAAENREIEARLIAEERALTERRATLPPDEFRALADDFDARVTAIRREQDEKERDLARLPEEARAEFFRAALPILAEIARERGALVILDARAVLLAADAIDVTDAVVARVDAAIGQGDGLPQAPAAPPPGTP